MNLKKGIIATFILTLQLSTYIFGELTKKDFWTLNGKTSEGSNFELLFTSLKDVLTNVPHVSEKKPSEIVIVMPTSYGQKVSFKFYQNNVIHPNLEKKYPNIQTYVGIGIDNPTHRSTIVINGDRIVGSVESDKDPSFFKSFNIQDRRNGIMVYSETVNSQDIICNAKNSNVEQNREFPECMGSDDPCYPAGVELVTYRFAGMLTEAVTNDAADGTVEGGLTWLAGAIAYVNAMYVRDVTFQLQIIENNDELIFTDSNPAPEAFNQDCGGGWGDIGCELGVVDSVLDSRIGSGGWDSVDEERVWDYGGLFDLGYPGGLAYVPGPTSAQLPNLIIFSHEVMHNFGSPHNYCGEDGIRTSLGGTIMTHRVNETSDMFSTHSTEWALNYQESTGPYGNGWYHNGYSTEQTNNIIPEVLLPEEGITIPANTPYILEGSSDPINENYTYNWESNDTADEQYSADPNSTDTPFLLPDQGSLSVPVFPHREGYKRIFPDMDVLLDNEYEKYGPNPYTGVNQILEKLPFASREMNMRLVVRTNDPYAGSLNHKNLKFFVDGDAGPFRVTSQSDSTVWEVGSEQTITWDVANTNDVNGVNCQAVDFVLSLNGGDSFDFVLAENVPNSGSHTFNVPPIPPVVYGRLMVKASDNIFFDINNGIVTILNNNVPSLVVSESVVNIALGNDAMETFTAEVTNDGEEGSVVSFITYPGQVPMSDDSFSDGTLPTGWSTETNAECDNPGWFITEDASSAYFTVPQGDGFYIATNDDECGGSSDGSNDMLYTNGISLPEGLIELSFRRFFTGGFGQTFHVLISTDNWENYTEIFNLREWDGSEEWVKETVRLHEYAGQSVEFAFHSNDNGNWASGVALDDIKLGMTPFWISSSSEGTIQFQGVETFNFSLSTSELNDGEYSATVVIEDIYQSLSDTLLVNLTVDGSLGVDKDVIPEKFILYQNYPNPFNPSTDIKFSLPSTERVHLVVYDLLGNVVREMVNEELNAGMHTYKWIGENQNGSMVSAGMYFYKIKAGPHTHTKKMILLK